MRLDYRYVVTISHEGEERAITRSDVLDALDLHVSDALNRGDIEPITSRTIAIYVDAVEGGG